MTGNNFAAMMKSKVEMAKQMSEEDKVFRYKGILYPLIVCPESHLKALEGFKAREDDVVLVAYPKCGFNWMVGVLRKIISEVAGVKADGNGAPPLIEFMGPEGVQAAEQAPAPRLLGTHLHPDNIPASFYQTKAKMLVIFRNPKDTAVSFFHFNNNNPVLQSEPSWDTFFSKFMSGDVPWGSYFDHALSWDKKMDDPNVMVVTFEELKKELAQGIRQISSFFGFQLTEAQVQQIEHDSTFSAMRSSATASHGNMGNVFFRKGEVGDWKNHFSPEQSREMDEAFNKHLAGTRLGAKLDYQLHCQ
ncbi:sulfotransferase 6B1 [Salarias fasciatus]|uniref:Sulfotransferase n=1 Tax=Salarias fasciatus TaxID=181472 RepID=A0A672FWQ1_SALFA|nr:sulfotransferase 6B1 [Salarias fasciatus]